MSAPDVLHRFLDLLDSNPREWGQWALSPLVPAIGAVVRMFVFVKELEGFRL